MHDVLTAECTPWHVSVEIANNALCLVAFELRCSRIRLPRKKKRVF
jgi:hypothetical protein